MDFPMENALLKPERFLFYFFTQYTLTFDPNLCIFVLGSFRNGDFKRGSLLGGAWEAP